jgi:hypothetical protein
MSALFLSGVVKAEGGGSIDPAVETALTALPWRKATSRLCLDCFGSHPCVRSLMIASKRVAENNAARILKSLQRRRYLSKV